MAVYKSSSFSRTRENEAKMGAYYTDINHCRILNRFFKFPQDEEVSVLEPSIGDGSAVISVTGADSNPNIKIFGVELNDSVAMADKQSGKFTEILCADFTTDVRIQKNSFSFCFGNPPYLAEKDDDGQSSIRMEKIFLQKLVPYLKMGAILVWVIPYSRFAETSYVKAWMRDFDTLALYRFQEPEYSKFHQVVIIGRKVCRRVLLKNQVDDYFREWDLANLPILPDHPPVQFDVLPSLSSDINTFTSKTFDENAAYEFLQSGLDQELLCLLDRNIFQATYSGKELLRPPITPKKDSKYLLVTSGFTDGEVGTEKGGDLHLMRGVANVVETSNYSSDEDDEDDATCTSKTVVVTTSTAVEMRIVENDGTITVL